MSHRTSSIPPFNLRPDSPCKTARSQPLFTFLRSLLFISFLNFLALSFCYSNERTSQFFFLADLRRYENSLSKTQGYEKYQCAFSEIPAELFHRLYIDPERLKKENQSPKERLYISIFGEARLFDAQEPGYSNAMNNAFERMGKTLDQPLSMRLIQELHDAAIDGVQDANNPHERGFHTSGAGYGLNYQRVDESVFDELRSPNRCVYGDLPLSFDFLGRVHSNLTSIVNLFYTEGEEKGNFYQANSDWKNGLSDSQIQERILHAIEHRMAPDFTMYQNEINRAQTYREKFRAMAKLLRKLEMAHFFTNGNQRTYSFLLLNRLLIENNLPPAILDDPYLFDGYEKYPLDVMAIQIENGIKNYLNLAKGKKPFCQQ